MKKVFITIKGTGDAGGAPDVVEFSSEGSMDWQCDKTVLCYKEGEGIGVDDVLTTLTITPESVVMERSGGLNSRLEIIPQRRSSTIYATAIGEMQIGVYGEAIQNSIKENGGRLQMKYTLDQNLQVVSRNTIEITVKEI